MASASLYLMIRMRYQERKQKVLHVAETAGRDSDAARASNFAVGRIAGRDEGCVGDFQPPRLDDGHFIV
ncbi:hypothetical protein Ae201684_015022 [Aphanomyces euteiches]|uniref:Uncharacterized protein n=1 Tax=Aphanomyces euteiches TaxID=100861 RepID=A0A6G0WI52_9STRA|nr:hypothetical protein Ae201684_015022 [Aphanomyces euteiches]